MNEDEAWNAFQEETSPATKSGATIAGKLDTLAQLLSDINADTSRTAETVIPQLAGDQGAIDAANEQAEMGASGAAPGAAPEQGMPPVPGAEGMGAPDMGMSSEMPVEGGAPGAPDMGAPDMGALGAPAPDMGAPDMGGLGGAPGGAPEVPEEIPVDDEGNQMAVEGTPGPDMAQTIGMDEGAAPDNVADMPIPGEGMDANEGGTAPMDGGMPDFSGFSYTPDDALNDFITSMTDNAHEALDNGDTQQVAAITSFIEGVKRLWTEMMGSAPAPVGMDEGQSMDLPAEPVPDEPVSDEPAVGEAPAEGGESEAPEASEESEAPAEGEKDDKKEEKKDDDDKEKKDMKKSEKTDDEEVEKCDGTEKSDDAPAEGGDIAMSEGSEKKDDEEEDEDAEKGDGKTKIEPGETGVKKGLSMKARMDAMAQVMDDNTDYSDVVIPLNRSETITYAKTADIDMKSVIEEFRNGGIGKSSRAPAESSMGDYRNDANAATKQVSAATQIIEGMRKSQAVPDRDLDVIESDMERLTSSLRARRGLQ